MEAARGPVAVGKMKAMPQGTVEKINFEKGFGFIRFRLKGSGQRSDIFFHISGLHPDLTFDETLRKRFVEFDVEQTPRGPAAVGVRPAYGVERSQRKDETEHK